MIQFSAARDSQRRCELTSEKLPGKEGRQLLDASGGKLGKLIR